MTPWTIECARCENNFEYEEIHSNTIVVFGGVPKSSLYFCKDCTEWLLRECRHYESSKEVEEVKDGDK